MSKSKIYVNNMLVFDSDIINYTLRLENVDILVNSDSVRMIDGTWAVPKCRLVLKFFGKIEPEYTDLLNSLSEDAECIVDIKKDDENESSKVSFSIDGYYFYTEFHQDTSIMQADDSLLTFIFYSKYPYIKEVGIHE